MRKIFLLLILSMFCNVIFSQLSLEGRVKYAYNETYQHFADFALLPSYQINSYFNAELGFYGSTAGIFAIAPSVKTKFNLPKGYLQLENRYLYRGFFRNKINEHGFGISLSYFYDYINVWAGASARLLSFMGKYEVADQTRYIIEPLDFLYRIEGSVRKMSSNWNLSLRFSNFDEFQMERWQQPMVTLIGKYNILKNLSLSLDAGIKPSGVFHIAANYYEFFLQAGVKFVVQSAKRYVISVM